MAKTTKGGLGRGLNSLLSGSAEEATPAEEPKPTKPTKDREVVVFEDEEIMQQPIQQKFQRPTATKKPISQEHRAMKENVEDRFPEKPSKLTISSEEAAVEKLQENTTKPAPYIEEDDHIVIKEVKERQPGEVAISLIQPNPDQPRTNFKQEEIEELAASIEKDGLLQPILVRSIGKNYQIIAGERRWQACKSLGLKTVPIRVHEADDDKALELALVENVQRSDLNPIEEAYGYRRMMERRGLTQSEVAEAVSKGRSTVANALRLLELPEEAQQLLFEEKISAGHARAILAIPSKEGRQKLTDRMIKEKISVREAETIARLLAGSQGKETQTPRLPTPKSFKTVARALREVLNTNVRVKTAQGKNKIEIEFKDEEELERLFCLISVEN